MYTNYASVLHIFISPIIAHRSIPAQQFSTDVQRTILFIPHNNSMPFAVRASQLHLPSPFIPPTFTIIPSGARKKKRRRTTIGGEGTRGRPFPGSSFPDENRAGHETRLQHCVPSASKRPERRDGRLRAEERWTYVTAIPLAAIWRFNFRAILGGGAAIRWQRIDRHSETRFLSVGTS